jgi:hypothetical protein
MEEQGLLQLCVPGFSLFVRTQFGSVVSPEDIPERMKFVVEGDIDSQDTPLPEAGGSQHLDELRDFRGLYARRFGMSQTGPALRCTTTRNRE